MKYGLSEKQLAEIVDVLSSYEAVEQAVLFGSRTIDTYKEASDVDIAIKGEQADWSLAMTIKDHFEEETYLPFFFDVVAYDSIKSEELKRHIDREGKVLVDRGRSEWRECDLKEVAEIQTGPFGSQLKNEQYITGGTPVITVEHINNFRIADFNYPSVTNDDKKRLAKYLLKAGDIIFTRVGSVDLSAFVKPHQDGWMFSSRMLRVRPNQEIDSRFLSYFFQQKRFRDYILNISVGATMPSINTEILKGIPVSYPPLPEQKAIAEVLSSLDDKIDLLHRQNKTLEQMAETLFRQWFIERKAQPSLNPSQREGGEEAGEDLEEYKVSDIANHVKENVKPASNPLLTYKHYSLPAFDNGKNPVIEVGKEILSNKYVVPPKTILVSKLNPRVPRIWAIPNEVAENSICSTEFQVFQPKKELYYGFLCFLFKSDEAVGELEMAASGTSGSHQRVKPQDILNITFTVPTFDKIEDYSQEIKPLIEKQQRNNDYIRTLESLRDTLLPKLMSGEIRVNYSKEAR